MRPTCLAFSSLVNCQPERSLLFSQLGAEGLEVTALELLQEALPRLAKLVLRPDLALLDTREQRWTEQDLRDLRLVLPGVPLLVLSGAQDAASLPLLRDVADALLTRPITIGQVVEAVKGAIGGRGSAGSD